MFVTGSHTEPGTGHFSGWLVHKLPGFTCLHSPAFGLQTPTASPSFLHKCLRSELGSLMLTQKALYPLNPHTSPRRTLIHLFIPFAH